MLKLLALLSGLTYTCIYVIWFFWFRYNSLCRQLIGELAVLSIPAALAALAIYLIFKWIFWVIGVYNHMYVEAWWLNDGRHGGSMVAWQTVVLQSRVQIQRLPSLQLTADLLVGCHLGWHLAAGWPLWGATEEKITKMNLWFAKNI
jgi:hypothetical protein